METDRNENPVEVFAGTPIDAGMIQSLLEQEGIEAFIQDELMGSIAPWYVAPGGSGATKVIVSNNDYDKALQIISDFGQEDQIG